MDQINWADLAQQANSEYVPIPVSSYNAIVESAEATQSSTGKLMFVLRMKVVGGAYEGRTFRHNVVLSTNTPQSIDRFFKNMEALGLPRHFFQQQPQPSNEMVAQKLVNAMVNVDISHRPYNGRLTEDVSDMRAAQGSGGMGMIPTGVPDTAPGGIPVPQVPQVSPAPVPQAPMPPAPPVMAPAPVAPPVPVQPELQYVQPQEVPQAPVVYAQPVAPPAPPVPVAAPPQAPVAPVAPQGTPF
jgi:hypothetical protein